MMTIATHSKANFSIIIKSYPLHIRFKPAYTPNIQKSVDSSIFFGTVRDGGFYESNIMPT